MWKIRKLEVRITAKIKIVRKISSNDSVPILYIPKAIREELKLTKGTYVKLIVEGKRLVVEPLSI